MTNESFSLPSELPATPHGIANCDPLLVQQTTRGAIQREGLLGVLIRPPPDRNLCEGFGKYCFGRLGFNV